MTPGRIMVIFACAVGAIVAFSVIHPWGNPRTVTNPELPLMDGAAIPETVLPMLEQKCADCHSDKTRWPLYSRLPPASWLIERDVSEGRKRLNLSAWPRYTSDEKIDLLTRIASEVRSGEMPVKGYLILHPHAKLSPQEQQILYDWAKTERRRIKTIAGMEPRSASDQRTNRP